jgi:hypothetical protein
VTAAALVAQVVVTVALGSGAAMLGAAVWLIAADDRRRTRAAAAAEQRIVQLHRAVAEAATQRDAGVVVVPAGTLGVGSIVRLRVRGSVDLAAIDRDLARRRATRDDDVDLAAIDAALAARGWRRKPH